MQQAAPLSFEYLGKGFEKALAHNEQLAKTFHSIFSGVKAVDIIDISGFWQYTVSQALNRAAAKEGILSPYVQQAVDARNGKGGGLVPIFSGIVDNAALYARIAGGTGRNCRCCEVTRGFSSV